jgi:hypothetical protein
MVREPFVLLAVDLDDEFRGMTVEVGDISIEGNLPPELRAMEARAAEQGPERLLRARHTLSESAGEIYVLGRHLRGPLTPAPLPNGRGVTRAACPSFSHGSPTSEESR